MRQVLAPATTSPTAERLLAADDVDSETRAVSPRSPLRRWLGNSSTGVLLVDIGLVALFSIISTNHVFWSAQNATNLLLEISEPLLLALGLSMLLGAGVFDLSLGANLVLSSVMGVKTMNAISGQGAHHADLAIAAGLAVCLATGALFGLVNGLVIAYLQVNSLIGTLGTLGIGTGVALLLTNGSDIGGVPSQLQQSFGLATIGIVPVSALVPLGIAVALWAVVRYTKFGLNTLAIGSSKVAAARAGINVPRHILKLTVLTGTLAGFAGLYDLARYLSTSVNGHPQDALTAFTAVVIGGTLLEGGRIRILGAVWGTVLAIVLLTGLVIVGLSSFYQLIAIGALLISVVAFDRVRVRRLEMG